MKEFNGIDRVKQFEIEAAMDYRGWSDKIPFLSFPEGWSVRITPPFAGALVRFQVKKGKHGWVSVYFDGYENLGFFGGPYWEVYPDLKDDVSRFALGEEKKMIRKISAILARQNRRKQR